MPLKLQVSLSKKVGTADYGLIGASCSVEAEMNNGLLHHDPDAFQQQVRQAYAACADAVEQELARHLSGQTSATNGHATSGRPRDQSRKATASQIRALHAIASRNHIELANALRTRYGVDKPEELSITEASQLIDELKAQTNGNGAKR